MGQSTEEVTIKINTVLGSTKGFDDAAKYASKVQGNMAVQAGQAVGDGFQSGIVKALKESQRTTTKAQFIDKASNIASSAVSGNWAGLMGMGGKMLGIGGLGVAGAMLGQQIGVYNTMSSAGLAGGNGLRGQGIYGTLMGVKDWFSGRSTRESIQDLALGQGEFRLGQLRERAGLGTETALRQAAVRFNPLTNADPFERVREERSLLQARADDMAKRRLDAERMSRRQAVLIDEGKYLDIRTGNKIDREQALKVKAVLDEQSKAFGDQQEGISGQQRDFEFGQLGTRKSVLFGSRQSFGAMLPADREFVRDAANRMRAGQVLSPAELQAVQAQPHMQEQVQQYLERQSDEGNRFNKFVAETGDPTFAKAAAKQIQLGGKIEHYLDENRLAQEKQKLLQDITDAGDRVRGQILEAVQEAGKNANIRNVNRGLIQDRTQEGAQ